jgi:hypothetical protein
MATDNMNNIDQHLAKTPSPVVSSDDTTKSRLAQHFGGLELSPEMVERRHADLRKKWEKEYVVGTQVFTHEQYLQERRKHSYSRDTLDQLGSEAVQLPKPTLPVLSCTVP